MGAAEGTEVAVSLRDEFRLVTSGFAMALGVCFLAVLVIEVTRRLQDAPAHTIQEGPQCFMAENSPEVPTAPLPPPPPPLPTLWDRGTDAEVAAVNDIIWHYSSDPWLVAAVIKVESGGRIKATSHVGARGLMQLMPRTAAAQATITDLDYFDGIEYSPAWNVRVGIEYLEYLLRRYRGNYDHALTAYNRGPYNTDAILRTYGKLPAHVKESYSDKVLKRKESGR